jgi:hypothetical protein
MTSVLESRSSCKLIIKPLIWVYCEYREHTISREEVLTCIKK